MIADGATVDVCPLRITNMIHLLAYTSNVVGSAACMALTVERVCHMQVVDGADRSRLAWKD